MRGRPGSQWQLALVLLIAAVGVLVSGRPVAAHTGLERTTPAADEVVMAPVGEIVLDFSAAVNTVQDGYEVLDPQGQVRRPDAIEQPAPDLVLLRFTTPMAGGPAGVRWAVTASDGHVIEGSFSFTIDAPLPTTTAAPATVAPTTTAAPTTTSPPTTTTTPPTTTTPETTAPDSSPPTTDVPTTESPATTEPTPTTTTPTMTLEEFLGRSLASSGAHNWSRVAKVTGTLGALLGLGWLAFVLVLDPGGPVRRTLLTASVVAGVIVSLSSVLEAAAHAALVLGRGLGVITDPVTVYDAIDGEYRIALSLRLVGGFVLATGAAALRRNVRRAPLAVAGVGAAALVLSFTFDGHTVSKGHRAIQFVADIVHVLAGAWWVAGVVALVWWAWRRGRNADATVGADGFLLALLRFSSYGAWALLALSVAGVAMTLGIIDGLGDLTGTTWGRVLLFKVAATVLAVAIGAYHRWVLIPALREQPDDQVVRERVTDALAAEAFLLVLAGALAGILVGSMV